jgi:D-serine deaminase-like pyridoxal phosphate-dependent protein
MSFNTQARNLRELHTPALLLDEAAFENNLHAMQQSCTAAKVALRPHAKAHRTPAIALRQVQCGAAGICVQKVSEARPFLEAGIRDVLVANELASPRKAALLAELMQVFPQATLAVCVDHPQQVDFLAHELAGAAARLRVFLELDVGHGRCGVRESGEARLLARRVVDRGFIFAGFQAYHGRAQHLRDPLERRAAIDHALGVVDTMRQALEHDFIFVPAITGGGTGTFMLEAHSGVFTEVQAGSYALMDTDYFRNRTQDQPELTQALSVLTTVMSQRPDQVVLDAGLKSMSAESGLPGLIDCPGWDVVGISDEHLVIRREVPDARPLQLGDLVRVAPSHCDPTMNLHDQILVHREDQIVDRWAIAARGLSY